MEHKTKKGLIIGTFPSSIIGIASGGVATHIGGLIEALNKKGIETKILYHKPFNVKGKNILKSTKLQWIKSVIIGFCGLVYSGYPLKKWNKKTIVLLSYYYGVLKKELKTYQPDFIHVHSLYNPAAIIVKYLGYGDRLIITDHGFRLKKKFYTNEIERNLCKENFSSARKVIYISDIYKKLHEESKLGDLNKLVKISNPTDFSHYPIKEKVRNNEKKIILFNGYKESLTTKGLKMLLDALSMDVNFAKNVKLVAICNDEAIGYIKERKWNFEYELLGKTKFSDILDLYTKADILVTPSKFESFGLVYTEALAVGIPVVGYYGTMDEFKKTLGEYIGESVNIEIEKPQEILDKIKIALSHTFNSKSIREKLILYYSWDNLLNKFLELYYPND